MRRDADGVAPSDLIRAAIEARLATTHVAFPGRVERWDATRNEVDVRPALDRATKRIDGSILSEPLPVIPSVPVQWPRSSGYGVTFPLGIGDWVTVIVADRSIAEWRRLGAAGDPRHVGTHRLDGAIAVPGVYPDAAALSSEHVPTEGIRIGSLVPDGPYALITSAGIEIKDPYSGIRILVSGPFDRVQVDSGGSTDLVALAGKVFTELQAIQTTLGTGTAGGNPVTWGTPYVPGSVAAAKLRAE